MTEYQFHSRPSQKPGTKAPSVRLTAESELHGAALALRDFVQLGCDVKAPLAHLDTTDSDGVKHTLLVEEILDWLHDPKQATFVKQQGLEALLN